MPKIVVVPLDQSDVAERALPAAEALAHQMEARLHLISVLAVQPRRGEEYYEENEPWRTWYQEIDSYLAERSSAIESLPVSTEILMGLDPGYTIHSALKEMDDALLVISTHGRSGFKRLMLGSTAARITEFASYPLVVVPARSEDHPASIARILVALDGSTFAEHALKVTIDLFEDPTPSIHLVRILDLTLLTTDPYVHARGQVAIQGEAHSYLRGLARDLAGRGIEATWEVRQAQDVVNSLVAMAEKDQADLLAMATHGRTGIRRVVMGSVADGVLRSATKPVLLVRPPHEGVANAPESGSGTIGAT